MKRKFKTCSYHTIYKAHPHIKATAEQRLCYRWAMALTFLSLPPTSVFSPTRGIRLRQGADLLVMTFEESQCWGITSFDLLVAFEE